jgi:hypothetical protein
MVMTVFSTLMARDYVPTMDSKNNWEGEKKTIYYLLQQQLYYIRRVPKQHPKATDELYAVRIEKNKKKRISA